jgi:hypothetical protein
MEAIAGRLNVADSLNRRRMAVGWLAVARVLAAMSLSATRSCAPPLPPVRGPSAGKLSCSGVVWFAAVQGVTRARCFAKITNHREMTLAFHLRLTHMQRTVLGRW